MGFPSRIFRSFFGPTLVNARPVEKADSQIPDTAFNGLFWQVAGMNLVIARASLFAGWNGSSFDVLHQQEAWNPKGDVAHPTLARAGTGEYSYTFASSYNDETGTAVPTVLLDGRVAVNKVLTAYADRVDGYAWVDAGAPLVVQVRLWDAMGTAVDLPFWLDVL